MDLHFRTLDLPLRVPFTIARGTQSIADNVAVRLTSGDHTGLGEAAPSEHYGELQTTVLAFLERLRDQLAPFDTLPISTLHRSMNGVARLNPAAKAAVDLAAYDLLGKRLDAPLYELLGLDPQDTPRTSFTIGIDTPEIMARKAADAREYPILKVKVGTANDEENLEAIRAERPDAVIRVDANEAWTPKQAVERIEQLSLYDLEFVEQPVAGRDLAGLEYVASAVALPIIADESCIIPEDVPQVAPHVDGINIKLMKCGGIYPALQMIHLARAHHLLVMMGCMLESSIAITAAAHLSPLIDYADLDGNLLIDNDPYQGVRVEVGRLVLPQGPGLGLTPA
ncbi:MAG: dipeptide epimerase [Chloroflexota bacterium]|nr:MAG: dipeptide epimerase [Chloroflexota bacterium]